MRNATERTFWGTNKVDCLEQIGSFEYGVYVMKGIVLKNKCVKEGWKFSPNNRQLYMMTVLFWED